MASQLHRKRSWFSYYLSALFLLSSIPAFQVYSVFSYWFSSHRLSHAPFPLLSALSLGDPIPIMTPMTISRPLSISKTSKLQSLRCSRLAWKVLPDTIRHKRLKLKVLLWLSSPQESTTFKFSQLITIETQEAFFRCHPRASYLIHTQAHLFLLSFSQKCLSPCHSSSASWSYFFIWTPLTCLLNLPPPQSNQNLIHTHTHTHTHTHLCMVVVV